MDNYLSLLKILAESAAIHRLCREDFYLSHVLPVDCWKMFKMPIINISHKRSSMNYHMLDLFKLIAKNSLIVFARSQHKPSASFLLRNISLHLGGPRFYFFLFTLKRYCLSTSWWRINQHIFNLIIGNFEAFTIRLKFFKYWLIISTLFVQMCIW